MLWRIMGLMWVRCCGSSRGKLRHPRRQRRRLSRLPYVKEMIDSNHSSERFMSTDGWVKSRIIRDIWFGLALLATVALAGCDYNSKTEHVHALYTQGNLDEAAQSANQIAADAAARDKLVYLLEEGAIQRAAGHLVESQAAFDNADKMTVAFESQAKERVSAHAVSIALNPAAVDYRGDAYDRIMMNTYKALDALELGDLSRARVELTRAYQRQQDAVADHKQEIADAQKSAQQGN